MTGKRDPLKWLLVLLVLDAVVFGSAVVLDAVRGRQFQFFYAVAAVMFAAAAIVLWRRGRARGKAK